MLFLTKKPKNVEKYQFCRFFVFLRSVGQVKAEKYAGICQPLGAREQGLFHGGGFGQLGAVRGAF